MNSKFFWTIGGTLTLIFVGQLLYVSKIANKNTLTIFERKIAGTNINLPTPDRNALVKPPKKTSDFTDPQIYAKSVILVDIPSSYEMYSQNPDEKIPIASTVKIMTALVVLENHSDRLNDIVTITYPMIAVEGSDIQLKIGEKISVNNLLKGLLIMSGNDTAYAITTYFGGKDNFVREMNDKARYLGLENTKYQDPSGLDDKGYSTARDLAHLASYALRNQTFRDIVKTPEAVIASTDGTIIHELKNSNRMLRQEEQFYYPYAIGIKTGFTNDAGHCLISAAEKDGHQILAVILNTNENSLVASAKESKKLLEWGFANWTW